MSGENDMADELAKLREYDEKLEADFAALLADRNALAEKNRACREENERLRENMTAMMDAVGPFLDTGWAVNLPQYVTAPMCKALAAAIEFQQPHGEASRNAEIAEATAANPTREGVTR